jgi:hypothetical protein
LLPPAFVGIAAAATFCIVNISCASLLLHHFLLQAMQLHPDYAVGTLRLSTGRHTTADDVDRAVQLIVGAARKQGLDFSSSDSSNSTANGL